MNAKVKAVEAEHGEDAEMPSKPRGAHVVSQGQDVDMEAYSFEEFFPSANGAKGKKAVQQMDSDEEL